MLRKNSHLFFATFIVVLFILIILPFGSGITFDSISFLQVGENFWSDFDYVHQGADGTDVFAAHRFPLYPLILGLFSKIPYGELILQISLFTSFTFLFLRLIKKSDLSPIFGLFILSYPILVSFYSLWTESLFIVLFLAIILQIRNFLDTDSKKTFRIILFLIVLLCLTRLVGLALAGSLALFFLFQKRWKLGIYSLLAGIIPFIGWTFIGIMDSGETARPFAFHEQPELFSKLVFGLGESIFPSTILANYSIQFGVGIAVFVLPVILLFISRKKKMIFNFLILLVVHFYSYLLLLIFCILFIDASIPLEVRTLLPAILTLFLMLIFSFSTFTFDQKNWLVIVPIFIALLSSRSIIQLAQNGLGYSSKEWSEFKFTEKLKSIQADKIYTNDQNAVWYFSQKKSIQLPQKSDLYSKEINSDYEVEVNQLINNLLPNEQIIWIRSGATAAIYPSYDEIKSYDDLTIVYDDWLCVILEKKQIIRDGFGEEKNTNLELR